MSQIQHHANADVDTLHHLRMIDATTLAGLLGLHGRQAVYNRIYRGEEGETVPYSIKIGGQRLWRLTEVEAWIEEKAEESRAEAEAMKV